MIHIVHNLEQRLIDGSDAKREAEQRVESVVKQAIDREKFLEEADAAFAALRRDPDAWDEEEQERRTWDQTAGDGLGLE